MRGSEHDHDIREYTIDARGMHIGEPFRQVSGILSGNQSLVPPGSDSYQESRDKDDETTKAARKLSER